MSYEITGTIIEIYDAVDVSSKFKKREFVLEKKEQSNSFEFTDYIKIQLTQDKCSLLDQFRKGEQVKVSFNLRGRKWEKEGNISYFTNLEAWKIERPAGNTGELSSSSPADEEDIPFPEAEEELNDLPF